MPSAECGHTGSGQNEVSTSTTSRNFSFKQEFSLWRPLNSTKRSSQDDFVDALVKIACMEIVNVASEYDTGIRIALVSWEDLIHPSLRDSNIDVEVGKDLNENEIEIKRKLEKRHRRCVIENMKNPLRNAVSGVLPIPVNHHDI